MTSDIHILHVDDDPEFSDMAATFLEREDDRFDIEAAIGASEALEHLADHPVDCIVSDYDMPGQTGIEFLEAVREDHPDLPFILYTGKGSEEVAAEAISADVTDYLQKDSGTGQYTVLANRIRNAVSARRAAAEAERRRHRLEQILKTVPGCVVQLDADGRFVFANDRAEEVLGLERDAVTERTYNDPEWDIRDLDGEPIPDEDLPFRRVRDSGEPVYGVRHSIQWPDGARKVLLVNGAPLFDEEGSVDSVVFSLTDITDQQDRARELERTQRRLELALETTDTGVWEWDFEIDEVVWNDTLQRTMGLDPGEFEGTFEAFAERVHPEDMPEVEEHIQRALETDSRYRTEFRMRHADGGYRWVDVSGRLVDDEEGERMVGVHHDITDRKEREQELEVMERRLEAILENTTTPMFMKDANGEYVFVNRGYRKLFGLQDEDIVGRTDHDIHPSAMAAELRKNDQRVLDGGDPIELEERIIVDGDERVFLTSKVPIYDTGEQSNSEEPVAVFGVATDITERNEREQELRDQYEQFRYVETVADIGYWELDLHPEGENEPTNSQGVYEIHELPGGEPLDVEEALSYYKPEDRPQIEQAVERLISEGEPYDLELRLTTAAGTDRWVHTVGEPVEEGGEIVKVRGIIQDVTNRKQQEQKLREQNKRLEQFTSVVSHDLRNPLRLAEGRLELADEDCESEHLVPISRAIDRMDRIIEDLLWLAREGRDIGATYRIDLRASLQSAWSIAIDDESADLVVADTGSERLGELKADGDRLQQMFENLLRNAIEHGGESVTVQVGRLDEGFYIEDDGPGINEEDREEIFEMGYTTATDGTGLGLSIVEQIVEAHGWEITVTEGSAGGARFEVTGVTFTD